MDSKRTTFRTYSELVELDTFEDRYEYLRLDGTVAEETFGHDRHMNQSFYNSMDWRRMRDFVIVRDNGCDLAIEGREIHSAVYIHHMNPMTLGDIKHGNQDILDSEYLICVSHRTHNAIHYGDSRLLQKELIERRPGDTKLW